MLFLDVSISQSATSSYKGVRSSSSFTKVDLTFPIKTGLESPKPTRDDASPEETFNHTTGAIAQAWRVDSSRTEPPPKESTPLKEFNNSDILARSSCLK